MQYRDNQDGTVTQMDDGGNELVTFPDPDGSFTEMIQQDEAGAKSFAEQVMAEQGGEAAQQVKAGMDMAPDNRVAAMGQSAYQYQERKRQEDIAKAQAPAPTAVTPTPTGPSPGSEQVIYTRPGTSGGTATSTTSQTQTTGMAGSDREKVEGLQAERAQAEDAALSAERNRQEQVYNMRRERREQELARLEDERAAQAQAQERYQAVYEQALMERREARERQLDPAEAFEGNDRRYYAFMADLGGAVAQLGARLAGGSTNYQAGSVVEGLINRSLDLQREQKNIDIEGADQRAKEAQSQLNEAKDKMLKAVSQISQEQEAQAGDDEERAGWSAMRAAAEAKLADRDVEEATKMASKVSTSTGTTTQTTPGEAAQQVVMSMDQATLESVGGREAITKFMQQKVGDTTVAGALAGHKQGAKVLSDFEQLAQANGGTLPTTGLIDLNSNETLRTIGSKLGFQGSIDASIVRSQLAEAILGAARAMGGPITESDREAAEEVAGKSWPAIKDWLQRKQAQRADLISQAAGTTFFDQGKAVTQAIMGVSGRASGALSSPGAVEPF